tara:strand:- start:446 stop:1450 length:1005 start_codon:yes stop_codon:yes gene_type:complete
MVVVKAFGYGSDAIQVARFLENKVDYYTVAYSSEGIALREAGVKTPILVLHPQLQNLKAIVDYRLEPNLYNFKIFNAFLKLADEAPLMNYPIHLKFNTGLNRLGFWHTDVPKILSDLKKTNHVKVTSLFSHLAASEDLEEEEFTNNQINNFAHIVQQIYKHLDYEPMLHILNTSGIVNYPKAQFDIVRLGIGLYGFGNSDKETSQLKNTHNLKSIISQIHLIKPGETVGYNRAFVAKRPSKTATIPIGHADGISRKLGNKKGYVLINNEKAKIIGNVCMDMIMVDITNINCKEGDEVIIFNSQEMIQKITDIAETIPYEILTAISQRVKKMLKE